MATNNCGKKLFLSLILRPLEPLELPDTSHYCHSGPDNWPQSIHHKVSLRFSTVIICLWSHSLKALSQQVTTATQSEIKFPSVAISRVLGRAGRASQIFYIQQSPHHLLSLEPDTRTTGARPPTRAEDSRVSIVKLYLLLNIQLPPSSSLLLIFYQI